MMTPRSTLLFGLLLGTLLPCVAGAQNPQPAPPQVTHPPVAPPSASSPPPEQIAPPSGNTALSQRLSRQEGLIKPPLVDPGMQTPVPQRGQGTMPVIPPPGTPGGDQTVVPK